MRKVHKLLTIKCIGSGCNKSALPRHAVCGKHFAISVVVAVAAALAFLGSLAGLVWFLKNFTVSSLGL